MYGVAGVQLHFWDSVKYFLKGGSHRHEHRINITRDLTIPVICCGQLFNLIFVYGCDVKECLSAGILDFFLKETGVSLRLMWPFPDNRTPLLKHDNIPMLVL